MKKALKYTLRVLLGLLILIVTSLVGGYIFLKTPSGKRWLNEKTTAFLSEKLGTKVSIGEIEFELPVGVALRDVVLEDHHHAVMIKFKEGLVQYFRYGNGLVVFGNIELSNLDFNLVHYKGEKESNFQLVLDRFASKDTTAGPKVIMNNIVLTHVNFHWDGQNDSLSKDPGIDWGHIDIHDFNTQISYLNLGDEVTAMIRSMNFSEKSGFKVEELHTDMFYSNKKMEYKNFYLRTPETELRDYVKFEYDDISKFDDFIDSVRWVGNFNDSKVSFRDIAYFTTSLINKKDIVSLHTLKGEGTIADMRVRNFDLSFGDSSYASGSGTMRGLPNIDETFMDVRMKRSRSSRKELMRILPETQLPQEIDQLGIVSLKGSFTGFISDFVAYGSANTSLGNVVSDINLKLGNKNTIPTYSGKIALDDFDLGRLTSSNVLGKVTVDAQGQGSGFTLDALRAKLNATARRFDLNGYSYSNIQVTGEVSKKFFRGQLNSGDKNLDMNFQGTVNYNPSQPKFEGEIEIKNADLKALKISNDSLVLRSVMAFNFSGINPDSLQGIIHAKGSSFRMKGKTYAFDTMSLYSAIDSNGSHTIKLYSDILNANLNGKFQPSKLPAFFKGMISKYIDSGFVKIKNASVKNQDVNFDINFRNMDFVFGLLHQDLKLKDSAYIRGSLNSENSFVHLDARLPGLKYSTFYADDIRLLADSKKDGLNLTLSSKNIYRRDSLFLRDFKLTSVSNSDRFRFSMNTSDSDYARSLHLNGDLDVKGSTAFLTLDSSKLIISDSVWNIHSKTIVFQKLDSFIDIPLLQFEHRNQRLKVVGQYSRKADLPIRLIVEDVSLVTLANVYPQFAAFTGDINGQVLITGLNTKPVFEAGLFISPLIYQKDTLGIFGTTATFDNKKQKLTIEGTLKNYSTQDELIEITGGINFSGEQNANLDVKFMESPVSVFAPFISGISNVKGTASADMKISGKLSEPLIEGKINFTRASFLVDYLQTNYHFSHEFALSGKTINVKDLDLRDDNDHSAMFDGSVNINKLSDVVFRLNANLKNFQLLNTKIKDNNLYYGQAYGSGKVTINGPLGAIHMYMQLTTNRGTQLFMPIGRENSYGGHDYITIIDHSNKAMKKHQYSLTGLDLKMDLDVTPDAHMQIIFDPRVGDVMEGNGHGNLSLDITTEGDFKIYGTYYIDKGSYRFTALDLPLKQFSVKEGSLVKFEGEPYSAELNVQAFYNVRTSLAPLNTDPNNTSTTDLSGVYNRIMNVETLLDLKGSLFTPAIKLNFDIPELSSLSNYSSDIDNTIRRIKSDDQELNKQVVALLVLGRFIPVGAPGFAGNNTTMSVTDLVNTQLNYWLSHFIPGFTFGYDNRGTGSTVRASKDLFNNRLNLSGSYDQNVSRNATYDASVTYKLKEDGSLVAKASSRSSNNPVLQNDNVNTYSAGISIRKEFNSFKELFKRKKKKDKKETKKENKAVIQPDAQPDNKDAK